MTMRDHAVPMRTTRSDRTNRSIEYRALYVLGFTVFLGLAVLRRALPFDRLFSSAPRQRMSIWREAREATSATIPYAFMG